MLCMCVSRPGCGLGSLTETMCGVGSLTDRVQGAHGRVVLVSLTASGLLVFYAVKSSFKDRVFILLEKPSQDLPSCMLPVVRFALICACVIGCMCCFASLA